MSLHCGEMAADYILIIVYVPYHCIAVIIFFGHLKKNCLLFLIALVTYCGTRNLSKLSGLKE